MYEILLMRHAKSDWHSHTADIERPLNKRGSRDAERMGGYLKQLNISPDRAVTSVARRAQDTANLVLEGFPMIRDEMTVDKELYLAGLHTLLEAIQLYAIEGKTLLLVAHNPGMDDIVHHLTDTDPVYTDNGKLMTTCAVAHFQLDSVDDLERPGKARLLRVIRPKEITL
jgi:phosphohistidine phosphatase